MGGLQPTVGRNGRNLNRRLLWCTRPDVRQASLSPDGFILRARAGNAKRSVLVRTRYGRWISATLPFRSPLAISDWPIVFNQSSSFDALRRWFPLPASPQSATPGIAGATDRVVSALARRSSVSRLASCGGGITHGRFWRQRLVHYACHTPICGRCRCPDRAEFGFKVRAAWEASPTLLLVTLDRPNFPEFFHRSKCVSCAR